MPYRVRAEEMLSRWRAAERELAVALSEREAAILKAEIAALRDEYQRVVEAGREAKALEPRPIPTEA